MARGDQLGRQWRVLQTLITSKRGKSAAELADELECHPRTVYRDLEALQIAGFPIYTDTHFHDDLESLFKKVKATLYIQEKIWHESRKISPQKDGSLLFEAEVAGTDEIKYWIMTWGGQGGGPCPGLPARGDPPGGGRDAGEV